MPRDLPIGNGSLLVTFDACYQLRDLYFPWVGQENHTAGAPCRFGVSVEGAFSWLSSDGWERELEYEPETLVTRVVAVHAALQLRLTCSDLVHPDLNIYLRRVQVENLAEREREVRLFFHFDCHLAGINAGDTVFYEPQRRALVHYKGRRYLWLCGQVGDEAGLTSYAAGKKSLHGLLGTWVDAEDGVLSHEPIGQGSVDSVGALHLTLGPRAEGTAWWWLAAGESFPEVEALDGQARGLGPASLLRHTANYWHLWVNRAPLPFADLPARVTDQYRRSLLILRTQIDESGAIIAANDSDILQFGRDTYSYMWPRDGAFVAHALTQAGHRATSRRFFELCARLVTDEGYLLHKYNPDGSLGSSWHPWTDGRGEIQLPIQEDETALVLWALWEHYATFRELDFVRRAYRPLVLQAGTFLARYRHTETGLPAPSYDLWEERRGIFSFTAGAVWAGLEAAARFAQAFGDAAPMREFKRAAAEIRRATLTYLWDGRARRFLRGLICENGSLVPDATVDSSLFGLVQFGMLSPTDPRVVATLEAVEEHLCCRHGIGGIARYQEDPYHRAAGDVPGNPWILCTLWLADWLAMLARDRAGLQPTRTLFDWVLDRALPSGVLAEQVHPHTGAPLSVSPLTWSHAAFVNSVHHYVRCYERIAGGVEPVGSRQPTVGSRP